jgi:hypothetical protein
MSGRDDTHILTAITADQKIIGLASGIFIDGGTGVVLGGAAIALSV